MYQTKITRQNPLCITILVDMSGSMANKIHFDDQLLPCCEVTDRVINKTIDEILLSCKRGEKYHNYFTVAVFGYNSGKIESLLGHISCDKQFFSIDDLASASIESRIFYKQRNQPNGEKVTFETKIRSWIKSDCKGKTSSYSALNQLYTPINSWTEAHRNAPAPIVIHISDGEKNDASDPMMISAANKLKSIKTEDGNLLFINIHLGNHAESSIFPLTKDEIKEHNSHAMLLYEMSSYMPQHYHNEIAKIKGISPNSDLSNVKAMAYNSTISDLLTMLHIGTSTIR